MTHEDDRRILYDWANGAFKSAKSYNNKKTISVGGHFHSKTKTKNFFIKREILKIKVGEIEDENILAPAYISVPRGTFHEFLCEEGSILLGTATELFDINDEIV